MSKFKGPVRMEDTREFVVEYIKNINEKIPIGVDGLEVDRMDLLYLLESYHQNLVHKINGTYRVYGADKVSAFSIHCAGSDHLERVAKDVWENPEKYWDIPEDELESDGGWDGFLKYLWVDGWRTPSGMHTKDIRLGQFVEDLDEMKQVL